eukprot:GHVN01024424.1.p1 GENE.GHVN01024424.1~~GHVN01024424.1.p1  ORF type:complete len:820 (-),score=153.50 GHVN01024424.1:172-2631(-)
METDGVVIGRPFASKARRLRSTDELLRKQQTRGVFRRIDHGKETFASPEEEGGIDSSASMSHSSSSQPPPPNHGQQEPWYVTKAHAQSYGSPPHQGHHMVRGYGNQAIGGHHSPPVYGHLNWMQHGMGSGNHWGGPYPPGPYGHPPGDYGGIPGPHYDIGRDTSEARQPAPPHKPDSSGTASSKSPAPKARSPSSSSSHIHLKTFKETRKLRSKLNNVAWTADGHRLLICSRTSVFVANWRAMTIEHEISGRGMSHVMCHPTDPKFFVIVYDETLKPVTTQSSTTTSPLLVQETPTLRLFQLHVGTSVPVTSDDESKTAQRCLTGASGGPSTTTSSSLAATGSSSSTASATSSGATTSSNLSSSTTTTASSTQTTAVEIDSVYIPLGHVDSAAWRGSDGRFILLSDRSDVVQLVKVDVKGDGGGKHAGSGSTASSTGSTTSALTIGSGKHFTLIANRRFQTDVNSVCFDGFTGDLIMIATGNEGKVELFPMSLAMGGDGDGGGGGEGVMGLGVVSRGGADPASTVSLIAPSAKAPICPPKGSVFHKDNQVTITAQLHDVTVVTSDPSSRFFATGGADQSISLFDLKTLTHIGSIPRCGGDVAALKFNHCGDLLAWSTNCCPHNLSEMLVNELQRHFGIGMNQQRKTDKGKSGADMESGSEAGDKTSTIKGLTSAPTAGGGDASGSGSGAGTGTGSVSLPLPASTDDLIAPPPVELGGQQILPQPPPSPTLYIASVDPPEFQWMTETSAPVVDIKWHPSGNVIAFVCESSTESLLPNEPAQAAALIVNEMRGQRGGRGGLLPSSSPSRKFESNVCLLYLQ